MPSLPKYATLCLAALAAACGDDMNDPAAPRPPDVPPAAAVHSAVGAPAIAFSDSAIGFCLSPGSTRNCVRLEERVRFISVGGKPLTWKAVSDQAWIVVRPARGTTPTNVRIFVAGAKLPPRQGSNSVSGLITVSAAGASNSPQTIPVKLQYYSSPPPR